jgi:hypothetical protein
VETAHDLTKATNAGKNAGIMSKSFDHTPRRDVVVG